MLAQLSSLLFALHTAEPQPIKVIGAGLGRTGTSSLVVALEQLGYKAYHMKHVAQCNHFKVWSAYASAKREQERVALQGGANTTPARLLRMAKLDVYAAMAGHGFNATTDFPVALLFADLAEDFPHAKVVLGVRSSGTQWAQSVRRTIGRVWPLVLRWPIKYLPFAQHFAEFNAWFWVAAGVEADLETGRLDYASLANAHDTWAARVKAAIPQERLLVHNAKHGFAPLCDFLDVPPERCPSKYPHVNDGAKLSLILDIAEGLVIVLQIVVGSLPLLILWFTVRKMTSTGQHNKEHGQKKAN